MGILVGMLIVGAVFFALAVAGAVIAAIRYVVTPPPPAGGGCGGCVQLQALWNSMSWLEKAATLPNFVAASYICEALGCGGLILAFG